MDFVVLAFIGLASLLALAAVPPENSTARAAEPQATNPQPKNSPAPPMPPADEKPAKKPERSYRGPLPELSVEQIRLRDALRADVEQLAGTIGERNLVRYQQLLAAANYISRSFTAAGYRVNKQSYEVRGRKCDNLEVELPGGERKEEIVIVGAHYDSVRGAPGANDNGSGVAGLLALARRFADQKPERTLRFVAFVNEEPPHFQTGEMGSVVYAKRCQTRKENVVAAISLETIGYYSDEPDSQQYPPLLSALYPSTGNFIGFVGNLRSRQLVDEFTSSFRRHAKFPSEKAALPERVPGVGWSDQWSFWQYDFQGLMVTDTAPFRYPYYHEREDTPDKIDYDRMARVVDGLAGAIGDLAKLAAMPEDD
jgi:hypothetical protein